MKRAIPPNPANKIAVRYPPVNSPYTRYEKTNAVAVCIAAYANARGIPTSRAVAEIAEMHGEQVRIKQENANALCGE